MAARDTHRPVLWGRPSRPTNSWPHIDNSQSRSVPRCGSSASCALCSRCWSRPSRTCPRHERCLKMRTRNPLPFSFSIILFSGIIKYVGGLGWSAHLSDRREKTPIPDKWTNGATLQYRLDSLTWYDHVSPVRCPEINWHRIGFRLAFQGHVLSDVGTLELIRDGQHWRNC